MMYNLHQLPGPLGRENNLSGGGMPISVSAQPVKPCGITLQKYEFPDDATVGDLRRKIAEGVSCDPQQLKLLLTTTFLNSDAVPLSSFPLIQSTVVKFIISGKPAPRPQAAGAAPAAGATSTAPPVSVSPPAGAASAPAPPQEVPQTPAPQAGQGNGQPAAQAPAPGAVNAFGLPLQEGEDRPSAVPQTPEDVTPEPRLITELCAVLGCSRRDAEMALKLTNNNMEVAASLLTSEEPIEVIYNATLNALANRGRAVQQAGDGQGNRVPVNPQGNMAIMVNHFHTGEFPQGSLLSVEEAESMLAANPQLAQEFSAMVARVSPDLALRLNEDHSLFIDLFRLVRANVNAGIISSIGAISQALMNQVGSPESGESAPRPPARRADPPPLDLTDRDREIINNILEVAGQDLSFQLVAQAYIQFGKDPDATLSVILDNREAFLP